MLGHVLNIFILTNTLCAYVPMFVKAFSLCHPLRLNFVIWFEMMKYSMFCRSGRKGRYEDPSFGGGGRTQN